MKTTFDSQIDNANSLLDVLLILKQKTMLDTHVATLAYLDNRVKAFDGKAGIWSCRPFPLDQGQGEYRIEAYYFSADGDSFSQGSLALIVFCDRNFIQGIGSAINQPSQTSDEILHSLKYGVITSLPGLSLTSEEKAQILDFGGVLQ